MRIALTTDHGGFDMKEMLIARLRDAGYEVTDFGAATPDPDDDYPDYIIPLARAVAAGEVDRGIVICGSGVGASVVANKVKGIRAGLCHDHYSVRQGVEDDDMNVLYLGGRVMGIEVAWDHAQTFISATVGVRETIMHAGAAVRCLDGIHLGYSNDSR
jgi:ribose 5-phosphate isomerase B